MAVFSANSPFGSGYIEPMLIIFEGNLGSGKSTLIKWYEQYKEVKTLAEPLDLWKSFYGKNVLEMKYNDKRGRVQFPFHMLATISRINQLNESHQQCKIRMAERSIHSSLDIFARLAKDQNVMSALDYDVACYTVATCSQKPLSKLFRPDLIIYVKADPEICFERVKARARKEEKNIPLSYLESLHNLHNEYFSENGVRKYFPNRRQGRYDDNRDLEIITVNGNLPEEEWGPSIHQINQAIYDYQMGRTVCDCNYREPIVCDFAQKSYGTN